MRVAIHQPVFFPWIGWVHKAASVDVFVVSDHVKPCKASPHVRAVYPLNGEPRFLSIQIDKRYGESFNDTYLAGGALPGKFSRIVQNVYRNAPGWLEVSDRMLGILGANHASVRDLNILTMRMTLDLFGVDTKIVLGSTLKLPVPSCKTSGVIDICEAVGARSYVSGTGGRAYTDERQFEERGVALSYQDFTHPIYMQGNGSFVPGCMAVDWWLWSRDNAKEQLHGWL